ncbi:adenosylmethionine decarboxylase [Candidatus Micrarchaeota archaeon]|nr:adenosylmethionine decarboxylase [Candidatus Micrarchaeota archaeon]MBD3417855.1 adenosylmethionine decarboxylase [Candidatus Micrarchaeota archaeon]
MTMGTHLLVNMHGCPPGLLERAETVSIILNEVVAETKLTKLGENHHQFEPYGVTSVILLAESHISIHTWPEQEGSAAVDIFTCGDPKNADRAFEALKRKFRPTKVSTQKVVR